MSQVLFIPLKNSNLWSRSTISATSLYSKLPSLPLNSNDCWARYWINNSCNINKDTLVLRKLKLILRAIKLDYRSELTVAFATRCIDSLLIFSTWGELFIIVFTLEIGSWVYLFVFAAIADYFLLFIFSFYRFVWCKDIAANFKISFVVSALQPSLPLP